MLLPGITIPNKTLAGSSISLTYIVIYLFFMKIHLQFGHIIFTFVISTVHGDDTMTISICRKYSELDYQLKALLRLISFVMATDEKPSFLTSVTCMFHQKLVATKTLPYVRQN